MICRDRGAVADVGHLDRLLSKLVSAHESDEILEKDETVTSDTETQDIDSGSK